MLFSRSVALPFALTAVLALTACEGGSQPAASKQPASAPAASASSNGGAASNSANLPVYRVAVDPTYQPFISQAPNGELEGFDADLLEEIGKREGFTLTFISRPWSGIFANLDNNSVDIVTGGAVSTEERRQKWAVSNPYYQVTSVLIAKEGSPIKNFEDAKGKRIAYTSGGSVERLLKKLQGTEQLDPAQNFVSSWLRVKSVMTDGSDAAIGISASFEYYAAEYPDQKLRVIYPTTPEYDDVVFVVSKNNPELLDRLNKGLEAVKQDGTLDKLKAKWKMNTVAPQ